MRIKSIVIDVVKARKDIEPYLADAYRITQQYVAELSYTKFISYLMPNNLTHNEILIFLDSQGHCVGFFSVKVYEISDAANKPLIISPYSYLAPHCHGHALSTWFYVFICLKIRLKFPLRHLYLATRTTVFSFHVVNRLAYRVYPSHTMQKPPSNIRQLADSLCQTFCYHQISDRNPFLLEDNAYKHPLNAKTHDKWVKAGRKQPDIAWYIEETGLQENKYILVLVPVTPGNIAMSFLKSIGYSLYTAFRSKKHSKPPHHAPPQR